MIDATTFPKVELAVGRALKAAFPSLFVSNEMPDTIPAKAVLVNYAGGGSRGWGEAAVNVGVNVYAPTDSATDGCQALVEDVQNALAVISNDEIHHIQVPAGAVSVIRQTPPFQRYFVCTVHLRGQTVIV